MTESSKPSDRNLRLARDVYQAFVRRDIPTVLGALSPAVEWGEPDNPFNPAGGTRHGHAGVLEWLRIGNESEEILVLEPRHFLANDDMVAVVGFTKCLVKTTGRSYETDFVHVISFRGGKIVRFQEFLDTYAAGEAFRPGSEPGG